MAVSCSKLAANAALASCRTTAAGIMGDLVLINFDEWQDAYKDSTKVTFSNGVFTKITLQTGDTGYHFTSHDKAFGASYSAAIGSYINGYTHQLVLRAFERTQAVKDFLNKAIYGRYVAIVINKDNGNDSTKYEVYGAENGLVVSADSFDSSNGDGIINELTLASEAEAPEPRVPDSFYVTNLASTKTAYEALYDED